MCGIAGFMGRTPVIPATENLVLMGDAIAHRGPDGAGFYRAPGVGLVHRRLAIIDPRGGVQPIANEDNTVHVTFNGEIYNYRELTTELVLKGHRFRTRSDTEVLVHLYEEEQENMVRRLRGMFAFAIWDSRRRQLFLVRDRLGIKPLYFRRTETSILFASEPKAILAWPGVTPEVDPEAMEDYLCFGMVLNPKSIFRGIEQLPPAHTLTISHERFYAEPRCYWEPQFRPIDQSVEEWCTAIRSKVQETVRAHLIADVPVGAFLSGGVDSTIVVGTATQHFSQPLRTFTVGFEDKAFCERDEARDAARRFGTQHYEQIVTPEAIPLLDELSHYFDEPFADVSALPTFLVAKQARGHVKVALSGDGGDEAFAGYSRHTSDLREAWLRRQIPNGFRRPLFGSLAALWPHSRLLPSFLRLKNFLLNLSLEPGRAYANTLSICRQPLRRRLLNPDFARQLAKHDPKHMLARHYGATDGDELTGMLRVDLASVLPDDYLVKVDRASMANGIEVRPPLLDHELLELAMQVPSRLKVRHGQGKWIFKEAFPDLIPMPIRRRPKKGFEMPIEAWLRGPLRDVFYDEILVRDSILSQFINPIVAQQAYEAHVKGQAQHRMMLWSLVVLNHWAKRYLHPSYSTPIPSAGHSVSYFEVGSTT